jgi:hypothetical protein
MHYVYDVRCSTSAYIHTSAYVSIRSRSWRCTMYMTWDGVSDADGDAVYDASWRAYVSIRQHSSAYVSTEMEYMTLMEMQYMTLASRFKSICFICWRMLTSIRQHTSAYVSIRQHRACVSCVLELQWNDSGPHQVQCWRMLTYADVCWRMLTYADVCWRMLTYADVCWQGNYSGTHQVQDACCWGLYFLHVSAYCYICVLMLLYMCPYTAIYVSSYCYICVLILLYMWPL